jgi:hypothetical protein
LQEGTAVLAQLDGTSNASNGWKCTSKSFEEDTMKHNRLAISLIAASLLTSGAALAQTTVEGTVGVGTAVEVPDAVITAIPAERGPSVAVRERVVVGQPLPSTVELRTVPSHSEYRYAVVNDRRVIVEPRTRKVIKIID